ncbi:MAG: DUF4013 domain-containing protein [Chlamydiae bacterium]|nr:DUF4013 domain-containing protein [Chlamydiota bacterium]MBI3277352.1 DUF4013 domain-containing protein [Chlamydiota bacterium]
MNIQIALSFPFKDSNWILKLLIGGALSFVSLFPMAFGVVGQENAFIRLLTYLLFLVLVGVFFAPLGYAFSILKSALAGEEKPSLPEWKSWETLFKDGLGVFIVGLAYGILIALLSMLVGVLTAKVPVLGAVFSLLQLVIGILILLVSPFIAIALCKVAQTGQVLSAFKFLEILNELKSKASQYISASLILLGVMQIIKISLDLNLFEYMMSARAHLNSTVSFPLVGFLTPFVMFWILIVSFRMYGEIYGKK